MEGKYIEDEAEVVICSNCHRFDHVRNTLKQGKHTNIATKSAIVWSTKPISRIAKIAELSDYPKNVRDRGWPVYVKYEQ